MNLKSSSISPIQIHLVSGLIAVLILSASALAVHNSWHTRKSQIDSSQLELTQVSDKLSGTQRERVQIISQITKLQSVVEVHDSIIQPTSINELAVQVVALAEKHSLNVEQFEPSPPTMLGQYKIQSINMTLSAPYQSISNWLDQLHALMPDIHVVQLSIASQSPTATTVSSTIQLNWYIPTSDSPTP